MVDEIWQLTTGHGPLVATAIHDGHQLRPELEPFMALSEIERLREEDPYTARWTQVAAHRIVGLRSRFEVDLNRPRATAVYRSPQEAWGLNVWHQPLPASVIDHSLAEYDLFYQRLYEFYAGLAQQHGCFVVYDLHSYNHRREGPGDSFADSVANPQVNVGTRTVADRQRFAGIIDRFISDLRDYPFPGGPLDVRENIKFFGGQHPRWTHETFPYSACVLAIEVKKTFMDEWTGMADMELVEAIGKALAATVPGVLDERNRIA